ncbi:unnamed protein product [Arabis nemorensis]|uniref:Uncharacterized protein n=1 Tax=Arabis nemorensis TaxID=586526 RepID=A0A565BD04_9BRAS|nr:unnamed protein product [Arabis nemorensis]
MISPLQLLIPRQINKYIAEEEIWKLTEDVVVEKAEPEVDSFSPVPDLLCAPLNHLKRLMRNTISTLVRGTFDLAVERVDSKNSFESLSIWKPRGCDPHSPSTPVAGAPPCLSLSSPLLCSSICRRNFSIYSANLAVSFLESSNPLHQYEIQISV